MATLLHLVARLLLRSRGMGLVCPTPAGECPDLVKWKRILCGGGRGTPQWRQTAPADRCGSVGGWYASSLKEQRQDWNGGFVQEEEGGFACGRHGTTTWVEIGGKVLAGRCGDGLVRYQSSGGLSVRVRRKKEEEDLVVFQIFVERESPLNALAALGLNRRRGIRVWFVRTRFKGERERKREKWIWERRGQGATCRCCGPPAGCCASLRKMTLKGEEDDVIR